MPLSASEAERDLLDLWVLWQRARSEEHAAWSGDDAEMSPQRRIELRRRVDEISERIIRSRPASVTGVVVQLRILATSLCQTPPDRLDFADQEERWLRSILGTAELLASSSLGSWSVDEDANRASGWVGRGK